MKSICTKCQHCWYAVHLTADWSHEEFDRPDRWCACGYILRTGTRRPCPAGYQCSVFRLRGRRPSIRAGVQAGVSAYGWYQRTHKGQPGGDYIPRPGDIVVVIDKGAAFAPRRYIVCSTDKDRISVLTGPRGGRTVKRSIALTDRLIIGYQTPAAVPDDPMLMLARGQQALGVPVSGVLSSETQEAVLSALRDGGVPVSTIWQTILAGLGYGPDDTALFQAVEGLPRTGVADWATWCRAYQYLIPMGAGTG